MAAVPETRDRILASATELFGTRGYDGTSLDDVADAVGVRKQTVLYYHPSKDALLLAVIDRAAEDLIGALEAAVVDSAPGWPTVESVVRTAFRVAVDRPELLGLVREVTLSGAASAARLVAHLEPLADRASRFLAVEMHAGRARVADPRLALVSAYASVIGTATEIEVLRAVGVEPTLRTMAQRRRELLRFLHAALALNLD